MREYILEHNGVSEIRRCPERGPDGVPDESRSLSSNPLSFGNLRSIDVGGEGLSRVQHCRGHDHQVLRAGEPDGQMRSKTWKVYGRLSSLQGRHRPQRRQRRHRQCEDQENNPICGLVSNRIQSGNQLPATHRRPWYVSLHKRSSLCLSSIFSFRGRPGQSYQSCMHVIQHNR